MWTGQDFPLPSVSKGDSGERKASKKRIVLVGFVFESESSGGDLAIFGFFYSPTSIFSEVLHGGENPPAVWVGDALNQ